MEVLIFIVVACLVVSPIFGGFWWAIGEKPVAIPREPKKDWYEAGPWKVVAVGEHLCVQQAGHNSARRCVIGWDKTDWKSYIKHDPWWAAVSSYREPTLDDIPILKQYCGHLNKVAYEKAKVAGFSELGGEI